MPFEWICWTESRVEYRSNRYVEPIVNEIRVVRNKDKVQSEKRERKKFMGGTGSSVVMKRPLDERSKHGRGQAAAECISLVREEGLTSNGGMCH